MVPQTGRVGAPDRRDAGRAGCRGGRGLEDRRASGRPQRVSRLGSGRDGTEARRKPMTDSAPEDDDFTEFNLRLYVAGQTPKSLAAIANLKKICEENLAGRYKIEVIDLIVSPQLAAGDQIVAIPTLVRRLPPPLKRMIGDLSNSEKVIVGLDLRPVGRVAP